MPLNSLKQQPLENILYICFFFFFTVSHIFETVRLINQREAVASSLTFLSRASRQHKQGLTGGNLPPLSPPNNWAPETTAGPGNCGIVSEFPLRCLTLLQLKFIPGSGVNSVSWLCVRVYTEREAWAFLSHYPGTVHLFVAAAARSDPVQQDPMTTDNGANHIKSFLVHHLFGLFYSK